MTGALRVGRSGLLCAVAVLLALTGSAHARAASDALGFGLQAVGRQPYFVFEARAGRTVRGAVRLVSTSGRTRTVFLRAANARTALTGGLDYDTGGSTPRGFARWIRLARSRVKLPARGAVEVPFVARIPRGVTPGDKLAGIVAVGRPPRSRAAGHRRFRLRFVSRLAIAVEFRVPGRLTRTLTLREAGVRIAPSGAMLGLGLASTGNALIASTTGDVTVLQRDRELFSEPIEIGAFVPGTGITYPVAWPGRPVEGEYRIRGTLRPRGGRPIRIERTVTFDETRIRQFRRQTGRPALEAARISALVLVAAVLGSAVAGLAVGRARAGRRNEV